jgi:hypothetical protein
MATIEIPDDMIFPEPRDEKERMLFRALQEYLTQLKQALIEIESKLP